MKIVTIAPQLPDTNKFTATLTALDNEKKTVAFVYEGKSYTGTYEGEPVEVALLDSVEISATGEIVKWEAPVKVSQESRPVGAGCSFQNRF